MTILPSMEEFAAIQKSYSPNASRSLSLNKDAYVDPRWFAVDLKEIIAKTWQWVCHVEKVRTLGSYVIVDVAGHPSRRQTSIIG